MPDESPAEEPSDSPKETADHSPETVNDVVLLFSGVFLERGERRVPAECLLADALKDYLSSLPDDEGRAHFLRHVYRAVHTNMEALPDEQAKRLYLRNAACALRELIVSPQEPGKKMLTIEDTEAVFSWMIERFRRTYGEVLDYEERSLFPNVFQQAVDESVKLLRAGRMTPQRAQHAFDLIHRRFEDAFKVPVSQRPSSPQHRHGARIGMAEDIRRIVAECLEPFADILYALECAHMHVDYVLCTEGLDGDQLDRERRGAWGNIGQAEALLARCDHQDGIDAVRCKLQTTIEYVDNNLGGRE